ncbi:MAG: pyridoxine 5'-phosphate synthase, partial [Actinobacteria bacterium]
MLLAVALLAAPAAAGASVQQETTFQDDDMLVFGDADTQAQTVDQLKALGVDRLRVSVFWYVVAPDPKSKTRPAFDATDPGAYPAANWERYDRLVRLAQAAGLGLNFDITGPAPLWATGTPPDRPDIESTYQPSPGEFGQFVTAVARRYAGDYTPPPPPAGSAQSPPPGTGPTGPTGPLPCPPSCARDVPVPVFADEAPPDQGALPRVDYWAIR